ncbi:MAG: hypothetical protein M1834_002400 [Cirrosporium novae-zelandiae]|nr:MAG: hypothetical protein M1834_002400 [Cirrosporium novae-zelandiae]
MSTNISGVKTECPDHSDLVCIRCSKLGYECLHAGDGSPCLACYAADYRGEGRFFGCTLHDGPSRCKKKSDISATVDSDKNDDGPGKIPAPPPDEEILKRVTFHIPNQRLLLGYTVRGKEIYYQPVENERGLPYFLGKNGTSKARKKDFRKYQSGIIGLQGEYQLKVHSIWEACVKASSATENMGLVSPVTPKKRQALSLLSSPIGKIPKTESTSGDSTQGSPPSSYLGHFQLASPVTPTSNSSFLLSSHFPQTPSTPFSFTYSTPPTPTSSISSISSFSPPGVLPSFLPRVNPAQPLQSLYLDLASFLLRQAGSLTLTSPTTTTTTTTTLTSCLETHRARLLDSGYTDLARRLEHLLDVEMME